MTVTSLLGERYLLDQVLGAGGMAVVYSAYDNTLARRVAIKLLRENYSNDPAFRARFHEEAKAVANLSHSNIVTVHDFGLDEERLFLVMEYVPGADLKTHLKRRGKFGVEEAVRLMIQACAGVGYAHRNGLIHCDIKPQNLLISTDHRLKVADFGIARMLESIQPGEKAQVVWGSPLYFSPEQAAGDPPSPASDVYSLGVVLYEMLTGTPPFVGSSPPELARRHMEDPPVPPRRLNPDIPPALDQIVMKVLSKEPAQRYRSAEQFGRVLINYLDPSQPVELPNVPREASGLGTYRVPSSLSRPTGLRQSSGSAVQAYATQQPAHEADHRNPLDVDWGTWVLGILAILAVGGLIPFLLWVYFTYNPPMP